ncbi:hypothetical protein B0H16DRAFT_1465320 [Mycena metata]|uniref:Uncharacterized protein n=1 Tax=Mycena metata TaxID=1033252 RepID=A0AAD7ICR2_9AGAR|nr:hypothetical protein B0H16DRAFT_1465320 [Mycena metata]
MNSDHVDSSSQQRLGSSGESSRGGGAETTKRTLRVMGADKWLSSESESIVNETSSHSEGGGRVGNSRDALRRRGGAQDGVKIWMFLIRVTRYFCAWRWCGRCMLTGTADGGPDGCGEGEGDDSSVESREDPDKCRGRANSFKKERGPRWTEVATSDRDFQGCRPEVKLVVQSEKYDILDKFKDYSALLNDWGLLLLFRPVGR